MRFLGSLGFILFLGVFVSVAYCQCDTAGYFKCGELITSLPKDGEPQLKCSNAEYKLFNSDSTWELPPIPSHGRANITISFSLPFDLWNWQCDNSGVSNESPSVPTPMHNSSIFSFYGCDSVKGLSETHLIKKGGLYDWVEMKDVPQVSKSCKIRIDVTVINGTLATSLSSMKGKGLWAHLQTALNTGFELIITQPLLPRKGMDLKTKLIIAFSVCGGTALIMLAIFFIYQRRKKANYAPSSYFTRNVSSDLSSINDPEKMGALFGVKFFTYDELEEATDSFNDKRELGDGGFGTVYLGKLKDGRTVAVKRLYENNFKRVEQFLNEVEILTRLRHKNLVMLYGCTSRHSRELLLVYEYVSNGTVADHVHGRNAKPGSLPWETRLKIAVETASALKYLHASDIIHRDVKTNNILLDDNFSVKVADFGLSRLFPLDVTHVSTAPQGTPGYVDPEYHQCYQLTDKSDVYSFGVVLVELFSSKPAVDITRHRHEINLSNMAINKIQSGTLQELVDPSLGFDKDCNVHKSVTAVAELAFQCLQSDKDMRPTMQEVLEILTRIQFGDSHVEDKADELDIFSDEFVLLKSGPQPLSPDSVTVKWVSGSVASNSSS